MNKMLLAVIGIAAFSVTSISHAKIEGFASRGPNVVSIGQDVYPTTTTIVMAVYGAGIFKSTDSGATFVESNTGLPNGNINYLNRDLAATPMHYAAMDGSGIYKSADNGSTWTSLNSAGLTCLYLNHISANTADPLTLYAGSGCTSTTGGGVFRSKDGGATWTFQSSALDFAGKTVRRVVNDEVNPNTVYAATTNGLWKSTNINNASVTTVWTQVGFNNQFVQGVNIDPTSEGVMLASVRGHGIWLSTDSGSTWHDVTSGLPNVDFAGNAGFDFHHPEFAYVSYGNRGIYKGTRSGNTISWTLWNSTLTGSFGVSTPRVLPDGVLFVTGNNGFYKSADGGTTFTQLQNGLPDANMNEVQTHPANANLVFATNSDTLWKSTDGGTNWVRKQVASANLRSGLSNQIVVDPADVNKVWISTFAEGIFKSIDGGDNFAASNTGLPANLVALDATVTRGIDGKLYVGFFGSLDGNAGSGVYRSDDGGSTWAVKTTGLSAASALFVRTIVPDPSAALTLYAVTSDGMYKTTTGGESWTKLLSGQGSVGSWRDIAIDPANTAHLYAARYSSADASLNAVSGVWKSTDGGATFTQTALTTRGTQRIGLIRAGASLSLLAAVWPFNPSGTFFSSDDGATWLTFTTGLRNSIRSFDFYTAGAGGLRIAGYGMGVRSYRQNYGADFEPNSTADLFWRHQYDFNYLWLMNGPAHATVGLPSVIGSDWLVGGLGDVDQDGRSDIIWYYAPSATVYAWLMNSTGVKPGGVIPIGSVGPGWTIEAVGDFNGDGVADILWRHTSGLVYVWYLNPGGTINSVVGMGSVDSSWKVGGVGDLNNDNNQDVVWYHEPTGTAVVWVMAPGGTMQARVLGQAPGWTIAKVGDFDGDGRADLLWRQASTGANAIWYTNGDWSHDVQLLSPVASDWNIAAVGDYDGDGLADVIWYYAPSGLVYQWLMNGRGASPTVINVGAVGANWFLPGQ